MQFITRMLIVLAVLGGLGYGSYAFGKYVLSARLFGPQSGNATTTASAGTLQAPDNVDVEVLPAPRATDTSDDSEVTPTRAPQPAATPDERVEITPSQSDDGDSSANNDDTPRARPTRRPRRKRRVRSTPRPTQRERTTATQPQVQAPPARDLNDDPPANTNSSDSGNEAPRVEIPTPRDNNPSPAPTRRRERRTVPDVEAPRVETPRREPRAVPVPTRRRESSPVPVPEGASGGGSSPIPVPG